jgi:hypothetical protein
LAQELASVPSRPQRVGSGHPAAVARSASQPGSAAFPAAEKNLL